MKFMKHIRLYNDVINNRGSNNTSNNINNNDDDDDDNSNGIDNDNLEILHSENS